MMRRSKTRGKAQAKKEFAVVGLGHFGASLARRLEAMGHTVLGIDSDMARVQAIVPLPTMTQQTAPAAIAIAAPNI